MRFEEFRARDRHILMSINPMNVLFVGEHANADGKTCHIALADGSQHVIELPRAEVQERLERAIHDNPAWYGQAWRGSYFEHGIDGKPLTGDGAELRPETERDTAELPEGEYHQAEDEDEAAMVQAGAEPPPAPAPPTAGTVTRGGARARRATPPAS